MKKKKSRFVIPFVIRGNSPACNAVATAGRSVNSFRFVLPCPFILLLLGFRESVRAETISKFKVISSGIYNHKSFMYT